MQRYPNCIGTRQTWQPFPPSCVFSFPNQNSLFLTQARLASTMTKHPLKIALIYELRSAYQAMGYSELDCRRLEVGEAAEEIAAALKRLGYEVTLVPDNCSLIKRLALGEGDGWDLAFNTAEGLHGIAREAQVPALLEAFQIPFTFSDAATMALCLDKGRTKVL